MSTTGPLGRLVLIEQSTQRHASAPTDLFGEGLRLAIEFPEHEFGAHVGQHLHTTSREMGREGVRPPAERCEAKFVADLQDDEVFRVSFTVTGHGPNRRCV